MKEENEDLKQTFGQVSHDIYQLTQCKNQIKTLKDENEDLKKSYSHLSHDMARLKRKFDDMTSLINKNLSINPRESKLTYIDSAKKLPKEEILRFAP